MNSPEQVVNFRDQAIKDVAEAIEIVHRDAVGWVINRISHPETVAERAVAYAVSQRERVIELEGFLWRLIGRNRYASDMADASDVLGEVASEAEALLSTPEKAQP